MKDHSERYSINQDNARWRIVDGSAVVIHIVNTYYYSLNHTGTFVWNLLLERDLPLGELVTAVADHYCQPLTAVHGDVCRLLEELTREDLVFTR